MIARDGSQISLWQDIPGYNPLTRNTGKLVYDVIIVGGGITGVSTALLLQQAGKQCLLLEGNNLGFGTTGGTTAHLNTLLDTPYTTLIKNFGEENARLVRQATGEAIRNIKATIQKNNIDCGFEETSAFLFAQEDKQVKELDDIHDACLKVSLDAQFSEHIPIPVPFVKAIQVSEQAKFHPLQYVFALAKLFEEAGGHILQNCHVNEYREKDNIISVDTTVSVYQTNSLIYATHIPPGVNLLHLRCAPSRSYAMAVTLNDENYPNALAYDMYDPYHYYRTQDVDGVRYLIVGGKDHKTGHVDNTDSHFMQLEGHVRKYYDVKEVAFKWSSQYFEPADGLPYIGHLPGASKNVLVATGYGGNGMVYSTVAARVLKDMIQEQENPLIKLFAPSRIKPAAGFVNFIEHNADVVKQFVGQWFSHEKLEELSGLAPGEGKVVKYEDHHIAISKDKSGNIHAINPTCTHMKCSVAWNSAEQSWDCPCHGARYSAQGKVITGPASKDLEVIELHDYAEKR
jgi:glycine/D-amino acid oxidase-like deaminating enzyme/nitrite reductase/ring-hydroxylating ferredoxin subunit